MFVILFIVVNLIIQISCQISEPVVESPLGRIQGYHKTSFNKRIFSAFEGIPYAQPPVRNLRFKDPVPVEPWSGTWKADTLSECIQAPFLMTTDISGDEDCLHLDVYVPRENPNPSERLDVIVHIHGGAFMMGSGHLYSHPEFLMDHDVIFVTMNYRLGIFGFLSTEDDVIAGNFGLKDQTLALKWIQENIASFGGNPDSVTLTGLSAGGSSVHYQYLSPLSKGLFHRGFSQSGTALSPWTLQKEPLQRAVHLAKHLGCPAQKSQQILTCLQQKPAKQLVNATQLFYGYGFFPISPFAPVVEKSSKPFINKQPYEILTRGEFHDLPWIDSVTSKEGRTFSGFLPDQMKKITEKFNDLAPYLLDCNYTVPKANLDRVLGRIKQRYLNDNQEINLTDMFSDRLFIVDAEKAAKIQAKTSKSPVYFLYFNYAPGNSQLEGAGHGQDGSFLFYNAMGAAEKMTPNDFKMKDIMVNMLISYAKNSKPTILDVNWKPTKHGEITFLNLTSYAASGIKVQTVENISPVQFWNSLGILENENVVTLQKDEL